MSAEKLSIWSNLAKIDPKQTKSFQRGGGFKGTAVKPIYQDQRMTELFGPCGQGWGMNEPSFQLINGDNREILVFCTVEVWWTDGAARHSIFGVGGDKVVSYIKANDQYKRPERWENDDEAFKKAFTDAVGNATKRLGMAADVHMGRFDDHKYVKELEQEFAEQSGDAAASKSAPSRTNQGAPAPAPHDPQTGEIKPHRAPPEAYELANHFASEIDQMKTEKALVTLLANNKANHERLIKAVDQEPLGIVERSLKKARDRVNLMMAG